TNNQWFETQDSISYWDDFYRQKIVWGEISDKTKFSIDLEGKFMNEATTFLMVGEPLLFLVGYLNSKLSEYLFSKIGTTTGMGTIRWKKYTVEQLLIPNISSSKIIEYENLVLKIISNLKNELELKNLTYQLDKMILSEFDFTEDEIYFIMNQ
ncbi:TaqI-like C-terminal specificity domain-containing protein, partial [Zhouia sp. PK063]|uniref:TaqI-like C-terminal specificity domain-containing protein n=1 Tax=Zhouia sp. PK063 TaxID=3373602 RepID=UPI0037AA7B24